MGARPDEDVWLELTFYSSAEQQRRTLAKLWSTPHVAQLAGRAEALNLRRRRSWVLATAKVQVTD